MRKSKFENLYNIFCIYLINVDILEKHIYQNTGFIMAKNLNVNIKCNQFLWDKYISQKVDYNFLLW